MNRRTRMIFALIAMTLATGCGEGPVAPLPGMLRVSTISSGADLDQDGYSILVDSDSQRPIRNFDQVLIEDVTAGEHQVSISGVAANCSVEGSSTRSVSVQPETTTEVQFAVMCDPTGIEVRARSTGRDYPLAGYQLSIGSHETDVPANGQTLLSRLPAGEYTVALKPGENCSVSGSSVVKAAVSNRNVSPVTFDVECRKTDKRIAFVSQSTSPGAFPVFSIMAGDLGSARFATIGTGHAPAWAPDGRLAYSTADCDFYYYYPCSGGLVIRNAAELEITAELGGHGAEPSWSPDGKLIAYVPLTRGPADSRLSLLAVDGFAVVPLNIDGGDPGNPSWAPDGERIVFGCAIPPTLCIVRKDGSNFVRLPSPGLFAGDPAWSPDGSRIALERDGGNGQLEIAIINPAGALIGGLTTGFDPAWSPDGSKIIFARFDGLFMMNADGSNVTRITTGRHSAPAWRP